MSLDEMVMLQARASQAVAWVVMMKADVTRRPHGWRCAAAPVGGLGVISDSSRADLVGWCDAVEACHERWRRAVAS